MPVPMLLADPEAGAVDDIIDLDRYPIDQPQTDAWSDTVHEVRQAMAADGLATLPDFLLPSALTQAATEIASLVPHVPIRRQVGSVYHRRGLAPAGQADPRNTELTWIAGHATRDMLAPFGVGQRLYVSSHFKRFIAACVGLDRIFEYADPLAGLVATILPPGGTYPWHYDTNEFVVTIMTRRPERGGRFEYYKDLRSPGDENLDGLARVLADDPSCHRRTVDPQPGHLQLFLGRYSLHRVTEVAGDTDRHVLVLSYADRPGVIGPVDRTRSVYGRVTEAHLVAEQIGVSTSDGLIL